ncbi:hypothetical protein B0A52_08664 [Exophiala mesophila]|uniref:Zn(2)-C6 fungal-type domain-containing protein n=1 Tax=Exophiala mesophila TaxID=212818 RepID=A0A438MWN2_EXOME|nr:hypothetical protein B0A52_08664 [Exophiala mesophila]
MFHTFETTQYTTSDPLDPSASSAAKRRTSTVRACEPCRRRKIRCNGEHPCETCQWYRKAASCHYTEPRQRQMPSRRSVEKISQTLQEYRGILQKLFPNVHPDQLKDMSRDRLVELISHSGHPPSPRTPSVDEKPPPVNPDAGSLEQLQPMPEEFNDVMESSFSGLKSLPDDANGLSMSVKRNSSYLGISSVLAVLRVITWLDPDCLANAASADSTTVTSPESSILPDLSHDKSAVRLVSSSPTTANETLYVDAYFTYIHPFTPVIEESCFRDDFASKSRTDVRWQLLMNTVLAMGSIAASSSEDLTHQIYFARAKQYIDMDTFDSAHLETVQALAILCGFYLQYSQSPNQANAIMGATFRMATMLGLHRDYTEGVGPTKAQKAAFSIEMRRRLWWSIFMLDSWVGNTLGRPTMGRLSHAITAKPPQEPIGQSSELLVLIQENVRLAVISTRMEECLAVSPILDEPDRHALDAMYIEWYKHSSMQEDSPCAKISESPGLTVLRNVTRWRYLSNRIILHRPVLLWYAMRKTSWEKLASEKKSAVVLCRELCADLINDIAATWQGQKPCQMSGWNATWLLYQATMVPLLSLYSEPLNTDLVQRSLHQVEVAAGVMRELQAWSTTATRSLDVINRLYLGSKKHLPAQLDKHETHVAVGMSTPTSITGQMPPPATTSATTIQPTYIDVSFANAYGNREPMNTANQEVFMDNMFDTIKWSTSWDSPIGGPQMMNGWDYASMQNWAFAPQQEEYFDPIFTEDPSHVQYMDMPHGHNAADLMNYMDQKNIA